MAHFSRIIENIELPRWLSGNESTCQYRRRKRRELDPWGGKTPWKRNGNPLQYSGLENSTDRGAWRATVHGGAKSWIQLSAHTHTLKIYLSLPYDGNFLNV